MKAALKSVLFQIDDEICHAQPRAPHPAAATFSPHCGEKVAGRNDGIPSATLKIGETADAIGLLPAMRGEGAGRRMRGTWLGVAELVISLK